MVIVVPVDAAAAAIMSAETDTSKTAPVTTPLSRTDLGLDT